MPLKRVPMPGTDGEDGWTQVQCDGCDAGTIVFAPDDDQRDGMICDDCEYALCGRCYEDEIAHAGEWRERPHVGGLFCAKCMADEPPHDAATCEQCVAARARARAAEAAAAEKRRADAAALDASVWPRMLTCIRGVSARRAETIAAAYPSPRHLLDAYTDARKRGIDETALVADVRMPDGKRVGPAAAGAVRRAMLKD